MVLQSSDVNRNIPEGDSIGHAIDIRFVGGHSFPDAFVLRVQQQIPCCLSRVGCTATPKVLYAPLDCTHWDVGFDDPRHRLGDGCPGQSQGEDLMVIRWQRSIHARLLAVRNIPQTRFRTELAAPIDHDITQNSYPLPQLQPTFRTKFTLKRFKVQVPTKK